MFQSIWWISIIGYMSVSSGITIHHNMVHHHNMVQTDVIVISVSTSGLTFQFQVFPAYSWYEGCSWNLDNELQFAVFTICVSAPSFITSLDTSNTTKSTNDCLFCWFDWNWLFDKSTIVFGPCPWGNRYVCGFTFSPAAVNVCWVFSRTQISQYSNRINNVSSHSSHSYMLRHRVLIALSKVLCKVSSHHQLN